MKIFSGIINVFLNPEIEQISLCALEKSHMANKGNGKYAISVNIKGIFKKKFRAVLKGFIMDTLFASIIWKKVKAVRSSTYFAEFNIYALGKTPMVKSLISIS